MSKMKRTLALLAVLAMTSTAFVACGGDKEESSKDDSAASNSAGDSSDAGSEGGDSTGDSTDDSVAGGEISLPDTDEKLTIVSWTDSDLANMFEQICAEKGWTEGIDIYYQNCGSSGGAASTAYATYLNSGDDVDLFCAEAGWVLNYIEDDTYAVSLDQLGISASEYANAYQYTVDIATNSSGALMGATWQCAPGGYVYNATLAEEYLGITSTDDMQAAVADWDKFKATAASLKEATGGSVTMCATLGGLWQVYSTGNNATWVSGTAIQTDAATEFATMAKEMVDNGYVDPNLKQWAEDGSWYQAGIQGETLGYFFSTWCLTDGAMLASASNGTDSWQIVEGPLNYYWGGTWLCVSKNCNTATKAAEFIRYFTLDDASMKAYALEYGDFVNNKAVMNEIVSEGSNSNDLLDGQDQFAVLASVADGITMSDTISKYDQNLKDTFNSVLTDNIDKSVDDIIAAFKSKALADNSDLTE